VVLLTASAFSLSLLFRSIHPLALFMLALGLARGGSGWIDRHFHVCKRLSRLSLPALAATSLLLGLICLTRLVLAERLLIATLPQAPPSAPNVLLVVLDTVRADRLSQAGYPRATTPQLDKLASLGVSFDQARSTAPWTLPSHASLFTGRLPHELRMWEARPLDRSYPTLAEYLSKHGYATAGFVGNTYFCNSWYGLARGFIHYEDFYEDNVLVSPMEALRCSALGRRIISSMGDAYNARPGTANALKDAPRVNRDFLAWLDEHPSRPFFAFLNYIDAHDPYQTPVDESRHFGRHPQSPEDDRLIQDWHKWDKSDVSPADLELLGDSYDDCLRVLDQKIGELMDQLKERGKFDNTLIIITSDHGEGFGEHGLYLHGQSLYRQETHVPLIMFGPKNIPAGKHVPQPVSLRDVAATVVDQLGLSTSCPFPGRSLARLWRDPSGDDLVPDPVISEAAVRKSVARSTQKIPAMRGPMVSLIREGFVLIRDALGQEELYDVANDPRELNNLVNSKSHRDILERLRRDLPPGSVK
jgi:arylsulfatase A-like enzyme